MGTRKLKFMSVTDPPARTRTELKQRARSQSFLDAVLVIEWLNAATGTAEYQRVLAVRAELEELRAQIDRLSQARGPVVKVRDVAELQTRHRKFDLRLARYSFKPEMNYSFATGVWQLDMLPKHPGGRKVVMRGQGFAGLKRSVEVSEPVVIIALARLAANRELAKVHLCTTCKKRWHVALRRIDQFCSAKCREYYHVHSDAYRERKRKSQREYREQLKRNFSGITTKGVKHAKAKKA